MNLQDHLSRRDSRLQALRMLQYQHLGSEITTFMPETRYLHLFLNEEHGYQSQAWLDVDVWLDTMDVHLPDIPWGEVPLDYLAHWLHSLQLCFLFEERVWHVEKITVNRHPVSGHALLLPAEPCPLLCLDWPHEEQSTTVSQVIIAEQIPFQLQVVLGYSQLALSELAGVIPGDLLLIKQTDPHLAIGQRRLYRLSYYSHQEVIVEEQSTERDEIYLGEEHLHELVNLPVEIKFVLDGQTVALKELESIGPGTTLALPPEAEQNLKIFFNKKLFARGELVALENGSLAVEVNHINSRLTENTK
ncbi:TPA: FliM/FliN family flagellar motor switch protein [Escherichia coli]|uniref:FliM/FliN family flagellar motor switch protein n=1 Tax=Escherichia coli TaxID=562 RepID=UPI001D64C0C1|nr:FliM/FliN family flagellar motor switch protein [Escherichia coli]